jgi:hypothetical protein
VRSEEDLLEKYREASNWFLEVMKDIDRAGDGLIE